MKIGYPCINRTLECKGNKTFRLKSYSEKRLNDTIKNNLSCLEKILNFNIKKNILFFRITSDLIPFASHPINKFNWQDYYSNKFKKIGEIIKKNNIRISMHPDQFIVLNSKNKLVINRSIKELYYHTEILDLMNLETNAKIQLHIGGAYKEKDKSLDRYIKIYDTLEEKIKRRLVIENDDRIYSLKDCLLINKQINIPILFDIFHHSILNNGENINEALESTTITWKEKDGIQMIDYSSQMPKEKIGKHAESININKFKEFIKHTKSYDFDIMLEIKNKEKSALKAVEILKNDKRFQKHNILK